ncbi:MAG: prephenate dehydrogenase/arogenate dehydrogenase family protein [Candidatus Thioglobus sp.]|nr:prephenate dehydrogenase/arogenate dehydrogenase family protein [Candidatus Thioglobus sp.]
MIDKICIIGVGLIGSSFALGLKKANKIKTIIGFDEQKSSLEKAKKLGVIDDFSLDISQALSGVQMVLIATPVNSFKPILELIKPHISAEIIITDVGSTKSSVVEIAEMVFGKMPANFVPAHPIAGKEKSGVEAADANLFKGKSVILTPQPATSKNAIGQVTQLWQGIGAKVDIMTAEKHDALLGMTSHLPHILAFALMDYLIHSNPDACDYAAGGFKDFSRIASSDAVMWRDICLNNSTQISKHITGYQRSLANLLELVEGKNSAALEELFASAKSARDGWLQD